MCEWKINTVLCDLVLAIVINTSAMLFAGATFTFQAWYPGVASAFFTNVLLHLYNQLPAVATVNVQSIVNSRKFGFILGTQIKINVHHRTDDLRNATYCI